MNNFANIGNIGKAYRDYELDDAMQRSDVVKLKAQLERLEETKRSERVNKRADEIAEEMRKKIKNLGETPCA